MSAEEAVDIKDDDSGTDARGMPGLMAPLLMEFFGTFLLTLTVGQAGVGGVALACLVWMGGHVSGGHFNPAVSLGVLLRGVMPGYGCGSALAFVFYVIAQYIGAILGGVLSIWGAVAGDSFELKNDFVQYMIINEVFFSTFLVMVVLHVATAKDNGPNQFYGAAIGGVVFAGKGVMNPAVAIAFLMHPRTNAARCLIPVFVPYVGGAFAALMFWLTSPNDFIEDEAEEAGEEAAEDA